MARSFQSFSQASKKGWETRRRNAARGAKEPTGSAFEIDLPNFKLGLKALRDAFGDRVADQYKRMMTDIERRAKRRAPVRTGTMRAGIWWNVKQSADGVYLAGDCSKRVRVTPSGTLGAALWLIRLRCGQRVGVVGLTVRVRNRRGALGA